MNQALILDNEIWLLTIKLYRQLKKACERHGVDTNDLENNFAELLLERKKHENTRP